MFLFIYFFIYFFIFVEFDPVLGGKEEEKDGEGRASIYRASKHDSNTHNHKYTTRLLTLLNAAFC